MISESRLSSLLTALREAGVGVGVAEVARLQAVFSRQPNLRGNEDTTRDRLEGLLRAVLVKSLEDSQVFERVFAAWFERAEGEVRQRIASMSTQRQLDTLVVPRWKPRKRDRKNRPWRQATAFLVLALGLATAWYVWRPSPPPPPASQNGGQKPLPQPLPPVTTSPVQPPQALPTEENPKSPIGPIPPPESLAPKVWSGWPALAIGLLALAIGAGIWGRLRNRRWVPDRAPEPVLPGPPRVFLSVPVLPGAQLLSPRQQEALVWGIGYYLAEEPTRRLDLAATVRATARAAGFPELRFDRARYSREVWLWTDEATDDPALQRLADEVETLLGAYGLPVERAMFRGLPDRLVAEGGQAFAPNEIDERRDVAMVAVLTDGRILAHQWAASDQRVRVEALLRALSSWPRLAFIDFSEGNNGLVGILARYGLPLLAPRELAGFLGEARTAEGTGEESGAGTGAGRTDDFAWAAVCALCPSSVAEETAFELRSRLKLSTSPWALRALRQEAPGPPGRLQWGRTDRARRLNWLRGAEEQPRDRVASESLLGKALDLWEKIYKTELEGRDSKAGAAPWRGTPAEEHLRMEHALLRLWRYPSEAVRELYSLYRGALEKPIRQQLAGLSPAGLGGRGQIELPWRWEALAGLPVTQVMLWEMGFAGDALPPLALGRSSRLRLGIGLCLGLGFGMLGVTAWSRPPVTTDCTGILGRPLRVGITEWPGYAGGIVANNGFKPNRDSIYFKQHQLCVEFLLVEDSETRANALALGGEDGLDVVWSTVDSLASELPVLLKKNVKARAIMQVDWSRGGDAIVADASIKRVEDLYHKKIALALFTPSYWLLEYSLQNSTLTAASQSEIVSGLVNSPQDARAAFAARKVDAAVLWEPDVTEALEKRAGSHILVDTSAARNLIADVMVAREDFINTHRQTIQALVEGWVVDGTELANQQPDNVATLLMNNELLYKTLGRTATRRIMEKVQWATLADNTELFNLDGKDSQALFDRIFSQAGMIRRARGYTTFRVESAMAKDDSFLREIYPRSRIERTPNVLSGASPEIPAAPAMAKTIQVNFPLGSDFLDVAAQRVLDEQFVLLPKVFPGAYIRVEGNTDASGGLEANRVLSQHRAIAVVNYLAERYNLPKRQFIATGNGSDNPVASNLTPEGRARNRRIDISIFSSRPQ
jgi:NitT/TauT family transport system substrate-binding protein